jgi:hypothetical protein
MMMAEVVIPDTASAIILGLSHSAKLGRSSQSGCLLTGSHTVGVAGTQMDVSTDDMVSPEGKSGRRMDTTNYQTNATMRMK